MISSMSYIIYYNKDIIYIQYMNILYFYLLYYIGDIMHKYIVLFLKGILIGVGKIMPGVSGSLIAFCLGIYEKSIYSICNFFSDIKENTKYLSSIAIGIIISIALGSGIIKYFFVNFKFITLFTFIGLLIGTLPYFSNKIYVKKNVEYLYIIFSFLLSTLIVFLDFNIKIGADFSFKQIGYVFVLGFIDAATMIIPGVSGTAIFILLGSYEFLLDLFKNILNIQYVINNFYILLSLFLGLIFGIYVITKIVYFFINYHSQKFYLIIFGFCLSSIFLLFNELINSYFSLIDIIIGLIFFIFGYFMTKKISKLEL